MAKLREVGGIFGNVIRAAVRMPKIGGRVTPTQGGISVIRTVAEARAMLEGAPEPKPRIDGWKSEAASYMINDKGERTGRPMFAWDRQKGERGPQYAAFAAYRDAGPTRTISDLINEGVIPPVAKQWSGQWSWVKRGEMYDEYMDRRARMKLERDRLERVERQARLGRKMQVVAESHLDPSLPSFIAPESVGDVVKLAEVGQKIERLAMGDSTVNEAVAMKFQWGADLPPWAPKSLSEGGGAGGREEKKEEEPR